MHRPALSRPRFGPGRFGPGSLAVVYTVCGLAWIVAGEWLTGRLWDRAEAAAGMQLAKGTVFVCGTGILLFVLLRRRERALERRIRDLASVGALLQAMAHQLKNPLFALLATLDAFERRVGDDPPTARHRAILREQAERIRLLVTGLQEYGQIGELQRRPTDVGAIVAHTAAGWQGRALGAGVRLRVEAPAAGELTVSLDGEAVGRAVGRLLENALQHTPAGGEVALTVRRHGKPGRLELEVADTGPGFREDELGRATEPLFSRRAGGAGLGLAVVERIAELHGGRVELGRAARGGARAALVLPL